eukprot:TRINITY_DN9898_c1_g1_i1.p1 TRINITY_DN9898_c1_g1~~TRINITY_DN9898_c1_g1_i1.p1  ORF type:complete len:388 (+),score=127.25 TRINITY_DN9898_c1_g1_i1:172-1335(+)
MKTRVRAKASASESVCVCDTSTPRADDAQDAAAGSLHGWLEKQVEAGVGTVLSVQKSCRSGAADAVLAAQAWCGGEDAYAISLPILFWHGYYGVCRHFLLCQCVGVALSNLAKAAVRLPRPALLSDGVWCPALVPSGKKTRKQLLADYATEWGFPSTHTLNAVANAFALVWALTGSGDLSATPALAAAVAAAVLWAGLLGFGRVYLGQHTPADVVGGAVVGSLWGCAYIATAPAVAEWNETAPLAEVVLASAAALVVLCWATRLFNPTETMILDSTAFLALACGCVVGARLYHDSLAGSEQPRDTGVAAGLTITGLVFVASAKEGYKRVTANMMRRTGCPSLTQRQVVKCVSYLSVVLNTMVVLPHLWKRYGLSVQPSAFFIRRPGE